MNRTYDQTVEINQEGVQTLAAVLREGTFDGAAQPAQLDAVTEDTSLVTLSIGGNDFGLFSALVGGCAQLAQTDLWSCCGELEP